VHHHHVSPQSPAAVGSFLKSALSRHLPVSWLWWVTTVCKHRRLHFFAFKMQMGKAGVHLVKWPIAKLTFREIWRRKWTYFMDEWNDEVRLRGGKTASLGCNPRPSKRKCARESNLLAALLTPPGKVDFPTTCTTPPTTPPSTPSALAGSLAFWDSEGVSQRMSCTENV